MTDVAESHLAHRFPFPARLAPHKHSSLPPAPPGKAASLCSLSLASARLVLPLRSRVHFGVAAGARQGRAAVRVSRTAGASRFKARPGEARTGREPRAPPRPITALPAADVSAGRARLPGKGAQFPLRSDRARQQLRGCGSYRPLSCSRLPWIYGARCSGAVEKRSAAGEERGRGRARAGATRGLRGSGGERREALRFVSFCRAWAGEVPVLYLGKSARAC